MVQSLLRDQRISPPPRTGHLQSTRPERIFPKNCPVAAEPVGRRRCDYRDGRGSVRAGPKEGSLVGDWVPLVPVDELPDDLRAQWDGTERSGLRDFIRMMAHAPDHFRRYNEVYASLRFDNHLGARVTELVRLAVAGTTPRPNCMGGRPPPPGAEGPTPEVGGGNGKAQQPPNTG